ncbi:hypothetical protein [Acidithiobacillus sp. AMEEHan]|uniref:hypothetical protein n=1 Tax=Acidithiobacillus sp. AMEEHan TaxID=2994951 RepID=UPI0027E4353B|nr:hypothetical protein [Acidithiobacillus sp. AMEEHan]
MSHPAPDQEEHSAATAPQSAPLCAGINLGYGHIKLSTPASTFLAASAFAPANRLYDGIGRQRDTHKVTVDGTVYEVGSDVITLARAKEGMLFTSSDPMLWSCPLLRCKGSHFYLPEVTMLAKSNTDLNICAQLLALQVLSNGGNQTTINPRLYAKIISRGLKIISEAKTDLVSNLLSKLAKSFASDNDLSNFLAADIDEELTPNAIIKSATRLLLCKYVSEALAIDNNFLTSLKKNIYQHSVIFIDMAHSLSNEYENLACNDDKSSSGVETELLAEEEAAIKIMTRLLPVQVCPIFSEEPKSVH